MNEYIENNSSEMLNLLLDGELDTSRESSVFSQLAGNEELRSEFKELLTIRDTVKHDAEAFTPPPDATNSIFRSIGFALPFSKPAGGIQSTPGSSSGFLASAIKKLWMPAASAIFTALFTAGVLINSYEGKISGMKNELAVTKSKLENIVNNGSNAQQTTPQVIEKIVEKPRYIPKYIYINQKNVEERLPVQSPVTVPQEANAIAVLDISKPSIRTSNINNFPMNSKQSPYKLPVSALSPEISNNSSSSSNYTLSFMGINAYSYPSVNENVNQKLLLSDFSLGLLIKISDEQKLGIEFGSEYFGQIFTNRQDEMDIIYEQNPLMFWGGLAYRYDFSRLKILGSIHPFLRILAGATEIGPLSKAAMGIQLKSNTGIDFNLGLEGSLLYYENQRKGYLTKKYGLTYGLSYSF